MKRFERYLLIGPVFGHWVEINFEWLAKEESEPFYVAWDHDLVDSTWGVSVDVFRLSIGFDFIRKKSAGADSRIAFLKEGGKRWCDGGGK